MSMSPEVIEYIAQNPLGSILSTYCNASTSHQQPTSSSVSGKQVDKNVNHSAIQNLIQDLISHNVTKKLGSQHKNFSSQLKLICISLNHGLELSIFEPLTTAILGKSSDLSVWKAVLQLVDDYADLPITISRKFVQQNNQSWEDYLAPLYQEFRYSSYENVGGFWEKYFKGRPWHEHCSLTYLNLSKSHNRDALGNFPSVVTEKYTWRWLNSLQNRFLDQPLESSDLFPIGPIPSNVSHAYVSRGKYFRLKKIEDTDASQDDKRIDLFIKSHRQPVELPTSWSDVLVLGHMTDYYENHHSRKNFYHLAVSVREVFWAQPLRRFIHGFVLSHTKLQLWVFDRSGAIGSEIIEIWKEPERFIYALIAYTLMSDDELGLDSFVQRTSCKTSITISDTLTQKEREFEIDDKPFQIDDSVVSHGTTYHQTKDGEYVVKFSWRAAEQRSEAEYLKAAKSIDGVSKLVGSRDIVSIKELRNGLVFSSGMTSQVPNPISWCISGELECNSNDVNGSKATDDLSLIFKDQILTCVVSSPIGRPLSHFESVNEFLTGMRDAIKAHWALFRDARILHRDISARNIILTDPTKQNGFSGILTDLDNAISLEDYEKNVQGDSGIVIGTTVYLAIGILEAGSNPDSHGIEHTYRHDLESFFYVFLSICMCYGWNEKDKANIYFLSLWRPLDVESIFGDKCGRLSPPNFERTILDGFSPKFKNLKELARKFRSILFSDGILTKATPDDPEIMYTPILSAFDEALQIIT